VVHSPPNITRGENFLPLAFEGPDTFYSPPGNHRGLAGRGGGIPSPPSLPGEEGIQGGGERWAPNSQGNRLCVGAENVFFSFASKDIEGKPSRVVSPRFCGEHFPPFPSFLFSS